METILNRLRGLGTVWELLGVPIKGNLLYALYIFTLFAVLFGWLAGVCAAVLYIAGESFAWGKWVGAILRRSSNPAVGDGRSFPYIHYIANSIIKEESDYLNYSRLALVIRGFIWWSPLLILAGVYGLSWWIVAVNSLLLAIAFPISVELGRVLKFKFTVWKIECEGAWSRQEIIYGFFQFLCVTATLVIYSLY